jgi:dolichol-phosphate mannosyltransferase
MEMNSTDPHRLVSVVLPIYKTAGCLRELYQRLKTTLESAGIDFELLMVEDGGGDDAWNILQEIAGKDSRVKAIQLSRNFGQHPAIAAAFENVSGNAVILMDADLQDRPEDIPLLLNKLKDDVDVVFSVKQGSRETFSTRLTSRLYHYVFSKLTRTAVPRDIGTFRAFSRHFLNAVMEYPERNILFGPLMFHVGFKSEIVALQHDERKVGKSGYTFRKRLRLAFDSILSYTDLPQRMLINGGLLVLAASGFYTLALIVRYLLADKKELPPGVTLLALLITFSLGVMMFSFGIIGTYIFRVYQEVLRRPRFIIARKINLPLRSPEPARMFESVGEKHVL